MARKTPINVLAFIHIRVTVMYDRAQQSYGRDLHQGETYVLGILKQFHRKFCIEHSEDIQSNEQHNRKSYICRRSKENYCLVPNEICPFNNALSNQSRSIETRTIETLATPKYQPETAQLMINV